MSTATDLNDSEMELTITDVTTGATAANPHTSSLAVPTIKLDQINNWTGVNELPFDPIAERTLEIAAHDEQGEMQRGALAVVFARPILIEGKGWACLYKLDSMGRVHVSPARGIDAVDALQQAFTMVHRQLQGMGRVHKITFGGGDDLGFAPAGEQATAKGVGCPVMNGAMSL
ncbi:MAG TPA: hypothetical protein VKV02_15195 [Acidobacteriaceae bacterium]|nr:hypothetical protein [Acidobacteriaceae bacterium]